MEKISKNRIEDIFSSLIILKLRRMISQQVNLLLYPLGTISLFLRKDTTPQLIRDR